MVTQTQNYGRFLMPVIEDAVQLWHFVQIARKYSSSIIQDEELHNKFIERATIVKEKHMKSQREMDSLDEILEELQDLKDGSIKPVPQVRKTLPPDEMPNLVAKIEDLESKLQKKPQALLRSIHSIVVEMDARLRRIENSISSSGH
jgi:hypothetical protein